MVVDDVVGIGTSLHEMEVQTQMKPVGMVCGQEGFKGDVVE